MFRVPLRFTLHKTLLKRRVTELSNLRGLAQVRAVGKQGRRSLCFHRGPRLIRIGVAAGIQPDVLRAVDYFQCTEACAIKGSHPHTFRRVGHTFRPDRETMATQICESLVRSINTLNLFKPILEHCMCMNRMLLECHCFTLQELF